MEYCSQGNLLKYLQKNQIQYKPKQEYVNVLPKSAKAGIQYEWKLKKALEICSGMNHLSKFKVNKPKPDGDGTHTNAFLKLPNF